MATGQRVAAAVDYFELARTTSRADFMAACSFPFLVGADAMSRPPGPQPTVCGAEYPEIQRFLAGGPPPTVKRERPTVLAVNKITKAFPSMITIGRTSNHDVVLSDVEISKFHAFVRSVEKGGFELVDAGSSNGTWVGDMKLRKLVAHKLRFGDGLRFGRLRFHFLDAGACWDAIRQSQT